MPCNNHKFMSDLTPSYLRKRMFKDKKGVFFILF